jgi:hypothetical protein
MLDSEARKIAAQAWAQVKAADDPGFGACAPDHQSKLAYKAINVAKSGTREDAFDEAVHAILSATPQSPEPVEVASLEDAITEATPPAEPAPAPKKKAPAKKKTAPKAKK